ncbi:MAG: homoserine kinase [Myxococcales bacterium]|nr:homoserine kinase [Myxococcota bacterium]MDW8280856.1 homoserine kinase [Myxococcales bacterium]
MSPRTPISPPELESLLRQYPIPLRPNARLTPLPGGTINTNYRLDTADGPLLLRVNEGKTEGEVRFEAALIWHLGSRGFPTPQLWRTRRGEPLVWLPGREGRPDKAVMLMQWAEGVELVEADIDEVAAREAGLALARLHLCTADFPLRREGSYTLAHIRRRIDRLHHEPRIPDGIVEHLAREAERLLMARRGGLPAGVGHNDLFPDNVLFSCRRRRRLVWVLDLEQAAVLPYVYDLAVALLSFCAAPGTTDERIGPLRRALARALLAGYGTLRPLSDDEREALYEELRFAALRFTVTRLTDVYLGAAWPPGEERPHDKDYRQFLGRLTALEEIDTACLRQALFDQ